MIIFKKYLKIESKRDGGSLSQIRFDAVQVRGDTRHVHSLSDPPH